MEVLDERRGDEICSGCGLASQVIYSIDTPCLAETQSTLTELEDEIYTICDKHHLSGSIALRTVSLLRKTVNKKTRLKAAQCLHQVLCEEKIPRSLKEISAMFYISYVKIGKNQDFSDLKPSDLLERVNYSLDFIMPYNVMKDIGQVADALYENYLYCTSPQAALAVAIFLSELDLTPDSIAVACQVSKQTLLRNFNIYKSRIYDG